MWSEQAERLWQLLKAGPAQTQEGREALDQAFQAYFAAEENAIDRARQEYRRQLDVAVGPARVAQLTGGVEAVRQGLGDPDVTVRQLSLTLAEENHQELLTQPALRAIITADPAPEMRMRALGLFALQVENTNDPATAAFLAELASDEWQDSRVRINAYWALIHLVGPNGRHRSHLYTTRTLDEVEWTFVRSHLPTDQAPERTAS